MKSWEYDAGHFVSRVQGHGISHYLSWYHSNIPQPVIRITESMVIEITKTVT